ncbi:MAG: alpha-2-macroglobulin family protein, partial [Tepidanaerobacteraceae bacterium]
MQKSKRYSALFLVVVILLVFGVTIYRGKNTPTTIVLASEITMEPTKHDSAGTDLDTEFIFSGKSPLDPKLIRENLKVEPAIDFTVKKDKDKQRVLVIPQEPLEPQKIYRFSMGSETDASLKWAFQTKGDFKVVATLPRDQSTGVPTGTGIEITFSHLNFERIQEFFTISPQVEGTFEVHKKTAVFVPKSLEPETIYTITVKKGLPLSGSSQALEEDFTFQFETSGESRQNYDFSFYKPICEFDTDDKPVLQFSYFSWDSNTLPKDMEFVVYKYQSAGEYIKALQERQKVPYWAYRSRQKYQEDASKLQSILQFSTPVIDFDYTKFVEFPETLPTGYYLAETTIRDIRRQVWFQVTDLSLYAAVDKNNTFVWVNDLSDGLPVAGAKIQLWDSDRSAVTDDKGLARLTTPEENSTGVYGVIFKDSKEAVLAISPWYQWDPESEARREFAQDYWKYLYLDRTLYKPDDTIHFWGLVKPRAEKAKPLDTVTVSLSSGGWRDNPVIDSKEITLDGFSFTDNMKLPNLTPGWYYLEVKSGDYVITSENFEVQTYSKPAYKIDIEPSKKAAYIGDKMSFQVKATFLEGTPAAYVPLEYHIQERGNGNVTTDDEGNASISYSPSFQQDRYSPIQSRRLFLTAKLPESGEITGEAAVFVLNNDIGIDVSNKVEGQTGTLEMNLNRLTVDRVNSGQVEPWDKDAFKSGPATNHPVKVKVYREVWEKREVGKYYDFINKKVETRYTYDYKKVFEIEGQTTTDQGGKATFSFPVKNKESYLAEITAQDFKGNPAICEHRVLGPGFRRYYDYSWYYLEGKTHYKSGEEVKLFMKQNEATIPSRTNGFLFFMAQDGILETQVKDSPEFNTVFKQELIPNFMVRGVYFDGRNYHEAYDFSVNYDKEEKALKIDVKTDKDEYKPKDTVKAEVEVTDGKGNPVKALVNVNLVDEALYALKDQHVDILGRIYQDTYYSGIKTTHYTHDTPEMLSGGAEKGGEGGSERRDFKDTVIFKTLTTNKQGRAQVSFQVPDNLTSWRLTCQAVTEDLSAATKTAPVVVKLPFFVDMVVNDIYLAGDQPVIPLRAFGNKLKAGTTVTYEGVLKTVEKTETYSMSGKAYTMTPWQLPSLEKGKYELTVTGKTDGGLTDTLT